MSVERDGIGGKCYTRDDDAVLFADLLKKPAAPKAGSDKTGA